MEGLSKPQVHGEGAFRKLEGGFQKVRVVFRKLKEAFKTTNTRRGGFQNMNRELSENTRGFQNHKYTTRGLSESRRGFQKIEGTFKTHNKM